MSHPHTIRASQKRSIVVIAAALALTMMAANAAFAINVTLTPVSDRSAQDSDLNGTFETLFPEADTSLSASVESPPDPPLFGHLGEHRTAIEFDISGIPSGTVMTQAKAAVRPVSLTTRSNRR